MLPGRLISKSTKSPGQTVPMCWLVWAFIDHIGVFFLHCALDALELWTAVAYILAFSCVCFFFHRVAHSQDIFFFYVLAHNSSSSS